MTDKTGARAMMTLMEAAMTSTSAQYFVTTMGCYYPFQPVLMTRRAAREAVRLEAREAVQEARRRFGRAYVQIVDKDLRIVRIGTRQGSEHVYTSFRVAIW